MASRVQLECGVITKGLTRCVILPTQVQLGGQQGLALGWGKCLAVLGDDRHAQNRSALGHALADKSVADGTMAMGIVAYIEGQMNDPSQIKLSLRSVGEIDTTLVSQHFGGGGHRNASSCIIPVTDFQLWRC